MAAVVALTALHGGAAYADADYVVWRDNLGPLGAAQAGSPSTSDPEFKYVPVRRY